MKVWLFPKIYPDIYIKKIKGHNVILKVSILNKEIYDNYLPCWICAALFFDTKLVILSYNLSLAYKTYPKFRKHS